MLFRSARAKLAVADFGYNLKAGSWRIERHLRFLGDVYGTGMLDIIGFSENNVLIGRNIGDGSFEPAKLSSTTCVTVLVGALRSTFASLMISLETDESISLVSAIMA